VKPDPRENPCGYDLDMTAITIGLSDEAQRELAARAARSGRSLEEYLADELEYLARKPAPENDDWVQQVRAEAREYGADLTIEQILAARDADRR
jgi:antitoxin FitA